MSEAKFTKGEWFISECNFVDGCIITSKSREGMVQICSVDSAYFDGCERNNFEIEQEANAYLMKSSPKMYEMLSKLSSMMTDINAHAVANEIESLLAEARGE